MLGRAPGNLYDTLEPVAGIDVSRSEADVRVLPSSRTLDHSRTEYTGDTVPGCHEVKRLPNPHLPLWTSALYIKILLHHGAAYHAIICSELLSFCR